MAIINTRRLGTQGLNASAIGLGCMGMSFAYGKADEAEAIKTLQCGIQTRSDPESEFFNRTGR